MTTEMPGAGTEPLWGRLRLVCATANPDKVAEIATILGDAVELLPRPSHVPWAPDNQNEPRPWYCMRWLLLWRQVASLWRCSSWAEQLFIRP